MWLGCLLVSKSYQSSVDFFDPRCWTRNSVHRLEREEDITKQRTPLDVSIHAKITNLSVKATTYSLEDVLSNVIAAGKYLGWQAS